eukprot:CAMPEP_0172472476 /NCGR_PEP_ID=MMETSP1065-20121228/68356_1 /TAXON_ID=265537 /ORGANISM="Amphiprora paludosa, Strain CCMP125" /LENGTH=318 /DNA_ID=CAMNT_0013230615 /DNA_START=235 /DNA_END=1191 /DNA_ORIENTATION=-
MMSANPQPKPGNRRHGDIKQFRNASLLLLVSISFLLLQSKAQAFVFASLSHISVSRRGWQRDTSHCGKTPLAIPTFSEHVSSTRQCTHPSRQVTTIFQLGQNDDNESINDTALEEVAPSTPTDTMELSQSTEVTSADVSLSTLQTVQTIGYRSALTVAALALAFQAVFPLLQQAGWRGGEDALASNETILLGALAAANLLTPRAPQAPLLATALSWGTVPLLSVVMNLVGGSMDMAAAGGLAPLFGHEILYFGLAYKVEAALGLGLVALSTILTDQSTPLDAFTCLAFWVLLFGKFLEPFPEDWVIDESEFLAKNRMD